MKLYPAIVTLHLLGGIGLLVLLALQTQVSEPRPLALPPRLVVMLWIVAGAVLAQVALGGWVSTNYAVLACRDFPTCQGSWWPPMDFGRGFSLLRGLGVDAQGAYLPFAALTAIHLAHRLGAVVVLTGLALLTWALLRLPGNAAGRRWAWPLIGAALWQVATGVSNVVLEWPLVAAIAHTGGAAALAVVLAVMLCRVGMASRRVEHGRPAAVSASMAS
jgi:cytochrome c oxidase assembly protein subunit 15